MGWLQVGPAQGPITTLAQGPTQPVPPQPVVAVAAPQVRPQQQQVL